MRQLKIAVSIILLTFLLVQNVHPFFVTDIIAYTKMALEYSKHLKALKEILSTSKKLKDDFEEFKGKFAKIHSGLKKEPLEVLLNYKDIEFYFNSPYIKVSKNDSWRSVWENTKNLFNKLPFLKDSSNLRKSELYKKNREFRDRVEYRIRGNEDILREYENVLKMISDTRKVISSGAEKYRSVEEMIKKYTTGRSTGKLIALLCQLKLDQLVKIDLLITSVRMKMEVTLKEKIIRMDLIKKREIENYVDSKRSKNGADRGF